MPEDDYALENTAGSGGGRAWVWRRKGMKLKVCESGAGGAEARMSKLKAAATLFLFSAFWRHTVTFRRVPTPDAFIYTNWSKV